MAKKSKQNRRSAITKIIIAKPRLLRRKKLLQIAIKPFDNRIFNPLRNRVHTLTGAALTISPQSIPKASTVKMDRSGKNRRLGGVFSSRLFIPPNTAVCVRRKIRREVLMAKTGGGSIAKHRPKFNQNSKLTCRR